MYICQTRMRTSGIISPPRPSANHTKKGKRLWMPSSTSVVSNNDNEEDHNEKEKPIRHRPFGTTSREIKRQCRNKSKKESRTNRKVTSSRQQELEAAFARLHNFVIEERSNPTAMSRAGVKRAMLHMGKWMNKLDPELLSPQDKRLSQKCKSAIKLVCGSSAARSYHKGKLNADTIFQQFDALEEANNKMRVMYNPGKKRSKKKPKSRGRKGAALAAKPLVLTIGGNRSTDDAMENIHQYVQRYCRHPPKDKLDELEEHLGKILGCRNTTRKRQAFYGRVPVGKNEKHQSLSAMMAHAAYSAIYEFCENYNDVNLTNVDFFAKRRRYYLSRARTKGEEHHKSY